MRILLLFWLAAPTLSGAYSNPIATSDGNTVYFQARTSPVTDGWYVARAGTGAPEVTPVNGSLADIDGTAAVLATAWSEDRNCGFAGSTCWLAAYCHASFQLEGPGIKYRSPGLSTFARLSRSGRLIWLEQSSCGGASAPPTLPPLNGLYDTSALKLIASRGAASLANRRFGRRAITDDGRALTLASSQLAWLDASGTHLIRNVNGVYEAVTSPQGMDVAYAETPNGRLHWVTGPDWLAAQDRDLGLSGSALALTEDGSRLLFLDANGSLQLYTLATAALRRLGSDAYQSFTIGGNTVFAVTAGGRLVRIGLISDETEAWLPPSLDIASADVPEVYPNWCISVCYGSTEYAKLVSPNLIVRLRGTSLGGSNWRVAIAGMETPLTPISDTMAWFQIPSGAAAATTVDIYSPELPIRFSMMVRNRDLVLACLGTLHEDFSRLVSQDDPAHPGEVVHIFLTGLQGVEPVADGVANPTDHLVMVANPPPLQEPDALEATFFGLAPGLVGIQQLDVRVHHAATTLFAGLAATPVWGCIPPPVAEP
jgi:uncharacterized protein (TIGR03437 family)